MNSECFETYTLQPLTTIPSNLKYQPTVRPFYWKRVPSRY